MQQLTIVAILFFFLSGCQPKPPTDAKGRETFCNPLDLSYRFCLDEPSRREAADPTVVWFKDRYYLFASKSGGYWHSKDLTQWSFLETDQIPTEEYAPTAVEIGDTLYFLASSNQLSRIYKSGDPLSGKWEIALDSLEIPVWDPAFFLDDDDRLYLYWGCSNSRPIYGVEVDYRNNFSFIGQPAELIRANPAEYGWEVPGDDNSLRNQSPWIEGAWMNKIDGKYYLQYSGPGTEYKSYSDAVYVSEHPLGQFTLQSHNPFAAKPGGFAAGAGHGSTFSDQYGNLWHIGTITISGKHLFERRLGMWPVFKDAGGVLFSVTKFGDYPLIIPDKKINRFEDIFPGWMLLSYGKKIEVSSSVDTLSANNMTDEEIRTYWAAESGQPGEFAILDLGSACDVYAIQLNFAEHNTTVTGRKDEICHRYTLESSPDGDQWRLLVDRSGNLTDNSHPYHPLEEKVTCRYLKITNVAVPDGQFALSGFRVFGMGSGEAPPKINFLEGVRNQEDRRSVRLNWETSGNAIGYNVSYGVEKDKLYLNQMVYDTTGLTINSLNVNQKYYFSIESFNENGIVKSDKTILVE